MNLKKTLAPPVAGGKDAGGKDIANKEGERQETAPQGPQKGFGRFEYINQTMYIGEWKIHKGRKVKHGQGKITFPGAVSGQISFG